MLSTSLDYMIIASIIQMRKLRFLYNAAMNGVISPQNSFVEAPLSIVMGFVEEIKSWGWSPHDEN